MTGQPRSLPDDLATLIAMPTVSGPPPDRAALTRAASWLARQLKTLGAEHVALRPTADAPIVLGERTGPPDAPTVLCYGHFDVVPPGPRSSWSTPPFAGIHRAGQIYGRGAADDKGPLLAQLHAARTSPDVRWKFLYDGAEEIGSPTLAPLLRRLRPWLADVDTVLICDTEATTHGHPTLTTSLRGQLTIELLARRHGNPLHPGRYGGAVPNPAQAIAALIASLHHTDGTIAIPGFTDNIRELPMLNTNDLTHRLAPLAQPGWGDPGYTPAAQITVRPALTVTALLAGPCDPAAAHAIPATARATIDIRLVPDQRPQTIYRQLTHHIAHHTPAGIALNLRRSPAVPPWASPTRPGPATTAMTAAVHDIWGTPPTVIRSGGTIPAVTMLTRAAPTAEIILLGLTLPSDNAHAPDEHVGLHQLQKAAATITRFTQRLARAGQR